ncbi:MAG: hypothetical protein U0457_04965 [Candidatus Sericytochromatia bacterium]
MKNIKFLILILTLGFFSCNNEKKIIESINNKENKNENIVETPKPKVSILNIQTKTKSQSICKKLELKDSELKMYEPYDIVTAKDGSYVYVLSNYKNNHKNIIYDKTNRSEGFYDIKELEKKKERSEESTYISIPEKVIYKITKDKKISLIKDFEYLSCDWLNSIEKKENGDLIILSNNKLLSFDGSYYKLESNSLSKEIYFDDSLIKFEDLSTGDLYPKSIFYDNKNIYYSFIYSQLYNSLNIEFIESYSLKNKIKEYLYALNEKYGYRFTINAKYISYDFNYIYESNYITYSNHNMYRNPFPYYSIYEGRPIFDISDIIKDKKEIEKVGKVMRVRKNSKGELFGLDIEKNIIWKIFPDLQKVELLAGSGNAGYKDGKVSEAEFNGLSEIDIDYDDNLYVTDTLNNAIRKITPNGVVSTFYKENL